MPVPAAAPATAAAAPLPLPAEGVVRTGDEIVVAGHFFHTGTRVITWRDPGGYNAYLGSKDNFAARRGAPGDPVISPPPDLATLQGMVDQFVVHYDDSGLSRLCFEVLQKRGLSAHFLLDVDGTVYQTLDLRERAYHATIANSRSVGVEIANVGAFPRGQDQELRAWYVTGADGRVRLRPPADIKVTGIHTPHFVARPARPGLIRGTLNGRDEAQYDFTPEQYAALIKLTAALHRILPKIRLDYPRDRRGALIRTRLGDAAYERFTGVLGHFHIQANKVDPGPAFDWEAVIRGARALDATMSTK